MVCAVALMAQSPANRTVSTIVADVLAQMPTQNQTEFDKQIMFWENKGKLVPTRELIKTPEQIEGIRRAGAVNTGVLSKRTGAERLSGYIAEENEYDRIVSEVKKEQEADLIYQENLQKATATGT